MADQKTAPVEKFRLTKEQMQFQKRYKNLKQIQELLQMRTLGVQREAGDLTEMWQMLEGEFQMLTPPSEPVKELQGMQFNEPVQMAPERYQLKY